jgi:acyl-CoA thioesterase I
MERNAHPEEPNTISLQWLKGKTVAFIGDSITADLRWNYVTMVVDKIADQVDISTMTVINAGVDSSSICDAMDRFPDIVIEHDPDVLVIFIGVNDSKIFRSTRHPLISAEVFEQSYRRLLESADAKRPRQKVLVTLPPLLFEQIEKGDLLKEYWYWTQNQYEEYVEAIRRLGKRPKAAVADVNDLFSKNKTSLDRLFDKDGVHPSVYGHRIIANSILEALADLGKQ